MTYDAVLTESADQDASAHLLRHIRSGRQQEDLCFAFWRPSTGATRMSALIFEILHPLDGERHLHGGASFEPSYLTRAVSLACSKKVGLAFMHNHLSDGWQGMSDADVIAERDRISPPARATGLPLVGLTIGRDGNWSARFWTWNGQCFNRAWCDKVRIVGRRLKVTFNDHKVPAPRRQPVLRRTIDTWGQARQRDLARLRIGVVGVGSVGCMVAETMARIGIKNLMLVDPDKVETHNLDRLLYAGVKDVGKYKVELLTRCLRNSATAEQFSVQCFKCEIQDERSYLAALDCDVLFSAVDRPVPKDLLNRISYAHCIPVISGGVFVDTKADGTLGQAAWSVSRVGPHRGCLRCDGQYTSSDVTIERDGSLDTPAYLRGMTDSAPTNQNVFPFSANLASFMVVEMLRLIVADSWWPDVGGKLHYSLIPNSLRVEDSPCSNSCSVQESTAMGDEYRYPFIETHDKSSGSPWRTLHKAIGWTLRTLRGQRGTS